MPLRIGDPDLERHRGERLQQHGGRTEGELALAPPPLRAVSVQKRHEEDQREDKVKQAALSVGIPVEDPKKHHDGTVTSDHGTQAIAFTPGNGKGRVVYTHGTTVDDFTHDLPLPAKNA
ncbi:hypothetical protein ACFY4I_30750 [Streptomyces scabiei]|uniref:hypothetical protein n=1 Tax=Streptomyces scabiei TaxID=1930 RepID=UPI00368A6EF7